MYGKDVTQCDVQMRYNFNHPGEKRLKFLGIEMACLLTGNAYFSRIFYGLIPKILFIKDGVVNKHDRTGSGHVCSTEENSIRFILLRTYYDVIELHIFRLKKISLLEFLTYTRLK